MASNMLGFLSQTYSIKHSKSQHVDTYSSWASNSRNEQRGSPSGLGLFCSLNGLELLWPRMGLDHTTRNYAHLCKAMKQSPEYLGTNRSPKWPARVMPGLRKRTVISVASTKLHRRWLETSPPRLQYHRGCFESQCREATMALSRKISIDRLNMDSPILSLLEIVSL